MSPVRRRRTLVVGLALSMLALVASHAVAATVTDVGPGGKAGAKAPKPVGTVGQLVVKLAPGAEIAPINRTLGSTTRSVLLASRGIYLIDVPVVVAGKDAAKQRAEWKAEAKELIKKITKDPTVIYAEANTEADIADSERFHYWPSGGPSCLGTDPSLYTRQPDATRLRLDAVHRMSAGAGQTIAVLDTGIDLRQPALAARVVPGGYDYVDDDSQPDDVATGTDGDGDRLSDEGYGHGTFVAGVASLVAPDAGLLPMRVLDAEGRGNVFVVAEALYDATARGADVVNMSFGTAERTTSRVLQDAIKDVRAGGAIVVAAAGNDGSEAKHYPAAMDGITSVAALEAGGTRLASFSVQGKWVDIAAPGENVISTLPCGYGSWSGTSVAAPFVAGSAAVLTGSTAKHVPASKVMKALEEGADHSHKLNVRTGSIDLLRSLGRV